MNLGVIIFTLARLITPSSAISLVFMTLIMPAVIGLTPHSAHSDISDILTPTMFETVLPLVVGFILVADNVANSKNLNDGEYLSLLFTRPISRACYVISKWIAGTIGVTICVYIAYSSYLFGAFLGGHPQLPDPWELVNIALNCLSAVALVVLVSTVPLRLGVILLIVIFYVSGLGPLFTSFSIKATTTGQTHIATITYVIGSVLLFLQSLVHQTIDINELLNSVSFSFKPLINYLSNVCLYLFLAIHIMNKREFYYASE